MLAPPRADRSVALAANGRTCTCSPEHAESERAAQADGGEGLRAISGHSLPGRARGAKCTRTSVAMAVEIEKVAFLDGAVGDRRLCRLRGEYQRALEP